METTTGQELILIGTFSIGKELQSKGRVSMVSVGCRCPFLPCQLETAAPQRNHGGVAVVSIVINFLEI
jgi:hypothetical protein